MGNLRDAAPFINVRFYKVLTEKYGEQGKNAFFLGFHLYAFRKAIRCAQRAVSRNLPLNYDSYQLCREAVARCPEMEGVPAKPGASEKCYLDGEAVSRNYSCATPEAFHAYGAPAELEEMFCRNVDRMMMYSYNPEIGLGYEVTETFLTAPYCEHHCKAREITPDMVLTKRTEPAPSLSYLTWSSYSSMAETVSAVFGDEGTAIAEQVAQDTIQEFGSEMWEEICRYRGMNLDMFYEGQAE